MSGAAASVGAAPAADVAAAGVRAALAPTHPEQQQEQDAAERHGRHKHPLWERRRKARILHEAQHEALNEQGHTGSRWNSGLTALKDFFLID